MRSISTYSSSRSMSKSFQKNRSNLVTHDQSTCLSSRSLKNRFPDSTSLKFARGWSSETTDGLTSLQSAVPKAWQDVTNSTPSNHQHLILIYTQTPGLNWRGIWRLLPLLGYQPRDCRLNQSDHVLRVFHWNRWYQAAWQPYTHGAQIPKRWPSLIVRLNVKSVGRECWLCGIESIMFCLESGSSMCSSHSQVDILG